MYLALGFQRLPYLLICTFCLLNFITSQMDVYFFFSFNFTCGKDVQYMRWHPLPEQTHTCSFAVFLCASICVNKSVLCGCRICDPLVGIGQRPTVCRNLCNGWFDRCLDEFFAFQPTTGSIVKLPLSALSSRRYHHGMSVSSNSWPATVC